MINNQPTVLLCFDWENEKRCRSLIRKNDDGLRNINAFSLEDEFKLDTIDILDSNYHHNFTKMANYQGYPLILGGWDNAKLEMLVSTEFPVQWNEQTDYPYADV